MTRKTMAEAIGAPLANQYLVLYGVTDLGTMPAALRVDAFLYDRNGRRLCEFFLYRALQPKGFSFTRQSGRRFQPVGPSEEPFSQRALDSYRWYLLLMRISRVPEKSH